tara:strand:- start:222 stop:398 length:177 start_codon:yes stop_codon:yes gene_type:complete
MNFQTFNKEPTIVNVSKKVDVEILKQRMQDEQRKSKYRLAIKVSTVCVVVGTVAFFIS